MDDAISPAPSPVRPSARPSAGWRRAACEPLRQPCETAQNRNSKPPVILLRGTPRSRKSFSVSWRRDKTAGRKKRGQRLVLIPVCLSGRRLSADRVGARR